MDRNGDLTLGETAVVTKDNGDAQVLRQPGQRLPQAATQRGGTTGASVVNQGPRGGQPSGTQPNGPESGTKGTAPPGFGEFYKEFTEDQSKAPPPPPKK